MNREKRYLLFSISIFTLVLFFILPPNLAWLKERIWPYAQNVGYQQRRMDAEQRKRMRWDSAYTVSLQIAGFFERRGLTDSAWVLLPPPAYFESRGWHYPVPEPSVFYYYTGLRTTWANSPKALRANWWVRVEGGQLRIEPVTTLKALRDTIASFRQIGYPL